MKRFLYKTSLLGALAGLFLLSSIFAVRQGLTESEDLPFEDIHNSYAKQQISLLHDKDIVKGYSGHQFLPKREVTRAEFAAMLLKTLQLQPLNSQISAFKDVPTHSWAYGWIQAGVTLGLFSGYSQTDFGPSQPIKREEAASMIIRSIDPKFKASSAKPAFRDASQISSWAIPFVQHVQEMEIMNGYQGYFRPQEHVTREEIAIVLAHVVKKLESQSIPASAQPKKIHMGWQYLEKGEKFKQLVEGSSLLNTISPRWFFLNKSGDLSANIDSDLLSWAQKKGYQVWPMVGNRFDREATHQLVSSRSNRDLFIQSLVQNAKQNRLTGLNIDFENLDPKDRGDFSALIKELAEALHKENMVLSIDVPPNLGTDWSDPYDYRVLGQHADYIVLMAYDQHWANGPKAGSVSSIKWMEKGIDDLLAEIPANKVIVALPLYSRNWTVVQGKNQTTDISLTQQSKLLASTPHQRTWDANMGQYVVSYIKDNKQNRIWLEESRSLALRYQNLQEKGLAGAAFWYVGGETPDVWDSLNNVNKWNKQVPRQ